MNTATNQFAFIRPTGDYVIILDDLEFAFRQDQLDEIAELHNDGVRLSDISKITKRDEYEVMLAIIHLHRQGKLTRPLARRV